MDTNALDADDLRRKVGRIIQDDGNLNQNDRDDNIEPEAGPRSSAPSYSFRPFEHRPPSHPRVVQARILTLPASRATRGDPIVSGHLPRCSLRDVPSLQG